VPEEAHGKVWSDKNLQVAGRGLPVSREKQSVSGKRSSTNQVYEGVPDIELADRGEAQRWEG